MQSKIYFENLDVMRFFAAYIVLLSHVDLTLALMGLPNNWFSGWELSEFGRATTIWGALEGKTMTLLQALVHEMGAMAVVFFFVLSGFLITLLLLRENRECGQIDLRRFYLRRILRIWPLYFMVVVLGLYVLPEMGEAFYVKAQSPNLDGDWRSLDLPYLLILPNLSLGLMSGGYPPNIGQAWSIGVEEQFYLFWPLLFLLVRNRPRWLFVFIGCLVMLKFCCLELGAPRWLQLFMATMKFESMAIGGLGAYLYHNHAAILHSCPTRHWHLLGAVGILGVVLSFWFCPFPFQDGLFILQSILFLLVILSGVIVPNRMPDRLKKVLIWLGQRSYGIYMWHMMLLTFVANFLKPIFGEDKYMALPLAVISTVLTIVVCQLSYKYYELPFLRLKERIGKSI